jgi:hypothetical protein
MTLTPEARRPARRACGRAALGRARLDAPLWWAAEAPRRRSSLVAVRAALPPTHIGVHVRRHARLDRRRVGIAGGWSARRGALSKMRPYGHSLREMEFASCLDLRGIPPA